LPIDTQALYRQKEVPIEKRVEDLLDRLTADEKLSLLTGTGFATRAIPRLGLPPVEMIDAPQGARGGSGSTQGPATLFPAGIAMAATWDPEIVRQIGIALGQETRGKGSGADILLGPCVNIHRTPQGGRNTESFSEDPYLAAQIAVSYIRGVQSTGTAACVKHFACNNEEVDRMDVDVQVDERALREIYLPAFQAAVQQGHVRSLMTAYNKINGYHATANHHLIQDILKGDWRFDGLVMSDWGAVHETAGVVAAGNDLEMPGGEFLTLDKLKEAQQQGKFTQDQVDDSVRRILRTAVRTGLLDGPKGRDHDQVDSPDHRRLALAAATEAIVLLKNQGAVLPLNTRTIRSIAIIGPNAAVQRLGNRGSAAVMPTFATSPLDAMSRRAAGHAVIRYAQGTAFGSSLPPIPSSALVSPGGAPGLQGDYFAGRTPGTGTPVFTRTDPRIDFNWSNVSPATSIPSSDYSAQWIGKLVAPRTGRYTLGLSSDDGSRLYLDGKLLVDNWGDHAEQLKTATIDLVAGQSYPIRVEFYQGGGESSIHLGWIPPAVGAAPAPYAEAIAVAAKSDVAVVFAGASEEFEGEGKDRADLRLPADQDALIQAVVKANPRTIVVLNTGTPVLMNAWADKVPSILQTWYGGEEGGNAITSILFGDANPSGKLPDTYALRREDYADFGNFPGKNGTVRYAEGIYVGYRHFDKGKITPLFPFGHGLSYTTFRYSGLQAPATLRRGATASVRITVQNTGRRSGAEVVQLYVRDLAPKVDRPVRELRGFKRVVLKPGQSTVVTLPIDSRAFHYWDTAAHAWRANPGSYALEIGSSSRDLRVRTVVTLR